MGARAAARGVSWLVLLTSLFALTLAEAQESPEQEADRLHTEAMKFLDKGPYRDGIDIAKRAVALREQALGPEHPKVAESLTALGGLHTRAGNPSLAESVYQQALAIREKVLGPEHPDVAKSLANLGVVYLNTGAYKQAERLYQRALAINEKILGMEDSETSVAMTGLANVYSQTAEYERAEPLYQRALAINERLADAKPGVLARLLNRFGALYYYMGAYARAKPLYQRALVITEKAYGPEHPEVAWPLGNLAILASANGEYVEAEVLYRRALAIQEKTLGLEHPNTVKALFSLGNMYLKTGGYAQAEPTLRRAFAIAEKAPGIEPESKVRILLSLGGMYLEMGSPELAEPLLRQGLAIAEPALGVEHPLTAYMIGSLGVSHLRMGTYDRATPLLKQSLTLTKAALGPESYRTAEAIYDLASLYSDTGAHLDAMRLYQRAAAIYEKALGAEHPSTAQALKALATSRWARGERQRALSLLQRVQRIRTRNAERFLVAGSESRKRDYLRALTEDTSIEVSFALSTPGPAATELGVTSVLQFKGRVLDAMAGSVARLRRSVAPTDQALFEQLEDAAGQFSALTYGQAGTLSAEQYRSRLVMLATRQQQLETELASRSQTFRREVAPMTLANIRQAIPANAVLVEWFRYTPFNPAFKSTQAPAAPRYVAYVLKRDRAPSAVDIGSAQPIEALAQRLRLALSNPASTDVKQHATKLSDKILAPLRSHFQGVEHILFSPDGELNLVPMAALVDASNVYLAERFNVSYLTSGRDLLRLATPTTAFADTIVVANPAYGRAGAIKPQVATLQPQRSMEMDRGGLTFRALAGTALEAQGLQDLLKLEPAQMLLQAQASEQNVKQLKSPAILHIASHGFFLSDQQLTQELRRQHRLVETLAIENPLLRSGIALAGANERSSGDNDDGILTALEAAQLDLSATQLVVMSACDSGVGEIQNGEGVYGLRRALALAGAQTQLTSLWKIPDDATYELMVEYYRRLVQGEGRAAALRSVQRKMMGDPALSHPYYWASFLAIGNWSSLVPVPSTRH
jgi:CHAT domain-containing protein/Tfp pilus assembly protein PilF